MANYCNYKIRAIGSKKATLMLFAMTPFLEYKEIIKEGGSANNYTVDFEGQCKWSVNFNCEEVSNVAIDLNKMTEENVRNVENGIDYWYLTMRQKSEVLGVEIQAHYWSEESGFDQFDHYRNGECLKRRKIAYSYDEKNPNKFDWNTLEFVGHEGEYDESIDGEEQDNALMAMFASIANQDNNLANNNDVNTENEEELLSTLEETLDLLNELIDKTQGVGEDITENSIEEQNANEKIKKYKGKIANANERVIVNGEFSIVVPEGYTYSVNKKEINDNRVLVFIKTEKNDAHTIQEDFSLNSPFPAPQCLTIMVPNSLSGPHDLSSENVREALRGIAASFASVVGAEKLAAIKETKDALVYYTGFAGKNRNTYFMILTAEYIYNGQIWLNDVSTKQERERIAKKWLKTVESNIVNKTVSSPKKTAKKTEKKARKTAEKNRIDIDEKKKDEIYNTIIASAPKTVSEVKTIIKKLEVIGEWKDSASKLKEYKEKLTVLKAEEKRVQEEKRLAEEKKRKEEEEKKRDEIYNDVISSSPETISEMEAIIKKLEVIGEWKDSASKLKEYKEKLTALKVEEKRVQEEKRLAEEKKRKEEEEQRRIRKEKYNAYLEKYPLKKEEPKIKKEIAELKRQIYSIVILDDGEKKTFKILGILFVIGLLDLALGIASEMAFVAVIGVICMLLFGLALCVGIKENITKSSNKHMKQKKLAELEAKMKEIALIPEFEE